MLKPAVLLGSTRLSIQIDNARRQISARRCAFSQHSSLPSGAEVHSLPAPVVTAIRPTPGPTQGARVAFDFSRSSGHAGYVASDSTLIGLLCHAQRRLGPRAGGKPCKFLDMVLPEFDHETAVTRLLMERAPESRLSWAPHPRSRTLGDLCLHLAELPLWGVTVMQQTAYDLSPPGALEARPRPQPEPQEATLQRFDEHVEPGPRRNYRSNRCRLPGPVDPAAGGAHPLHDAAGLCFPVPGPRSPDSPPRPIECLSAPLRGTAARDLWTDSRRPRAATL